MPRLFLTPFVIAGLLFLPSCSNTEAKACEAAEISRDTYNQKAAFQQAEANALDNPNSTYDQSIKRWNLQKEMVENYKLSLRVILTYPNCFTPEQVVEAQAYLDANK